MYLRIAIDGKSYEISIKRTV
ncbi:MAG: hypothetical protein ACOH1X_06310 [Kaistella sp.]